VAGILWLAMTLGFGIYVANFTDYGATYGSLAAVIVLLTWLYLSSYVLMLEQSSILNSNATRPLPKRKPLRKSRQVREP
jgi:membrane protein